MIPVLLALSVLTFAIIKAPPGDYGDYIRAQLMNQGGASFEKAEAEANVYRRQHGLLDPIPIQYFHWISGIVTRGDFGDSFFFNQPVAHIVAQRLRATLMLALTCHFLDSLLGISFGILAATQQYRWTDTLLSADAFLGTTVPRFLAAIVILYILVFRLSAVEVGSF